MTDSCPYTASVALTSSKKVVLFDIDEVLYPFAHSYHSWLVQEHGLGLYYDNAQHYDDLFEKEWHQELSEKYLTTPQGLSVPPLEKGEKVVQELLKKYHVVLCTGREANVHAEATQTWLQRWIPSLRDIYYVGPVEHKENSKSQKAKVAEETGAVAIFDDYSKFLQGLPEHCVGYLVERTNGLPSDVGAMCWEHALDKFYACENNKNMKNYKN